MTDLPIAVHFVAEAPQFDVMRIFHAVFAAQIAVIRTARVVAVFHKRTRFLGAAQTQIDRHHTFGVCLFAPFEKFVGAEGVRLRHAPGKF